MMNRLNPKSKSSKKDPKEPKPPKAKAEKVCSGCNKVRPIWKNKTVEGEKKSYCQTCAKRVDLESSKKKKVEARQKKANSISKLTEVLDKTFSLFIRLRDTDRNGNFTCCTCGEKKEWHQLNAGHFISRRFMGTRWDENNVHGQCSKCNVILSGEQFNYSLFMDATYGEGSAKRMHSKAQEVKKFTAEEIKELITYYQNEVREMVKSKSFQTPKV
jgi:hypothetical protein